MTSSNAPSNPAQIWADDLCTQLEQQRHRACLVLCGSADWHQAWLKRLIRPNWQGLFIGETSPHPQATPQNPKQLRHLLGQETDFALFDAEAGLEADALGIVGGLIRAGGLCLICLPPKADFLNHPNPALAAFLNYPLTPEDSLKGFQAHLWHQLHRHALWLEENQIDPAWPNLHHLPSAPSTPPLNRDVTQPTADQAEALHAIQHVAFGHRKRPLLLTADRGRGKSTTLGLACVALLQAGKRRLTLSAARLPQVQTAFDTIENALPQLALSGFVLREKRPGLVIFDIDQDVAEIRFRAPDDLIRAPADTELLLVDEAAHLPLPMLFALLKSHSRTVLASTEHGYEGSGRGFRLKLTEHLDAHYPGWKRHTLTTPIRWADKDPLENTLNQLFLLDTAPEKDITDPTLIRQVQIERIDHPAELAQPDNRADLQRLFQLLTQAHYQTRPNDLMQLLEIPNQQLWVARAQGQIVAVLFAVGEGGLPNEPGRRFQGHLFPQLLKRHTHHPDWLSLRGWRIQRLAVWPSVQRLGLGRQLTAHFIEANQAEADTLSVSFSADAGLIRFWTSLDFQPLHLGLKRDQASGQHSAALCYPLTEKAARLTQQAQQQFQSEFAWNLTQPFQHLESDLALAILRGQPPALPSHFPNGYLQDQPFESVAFALRQWTLGQLTQLEDSDTLALWLRKVVQHQAWSDVVAASPFPHRKALEAHFKNWLAQQLAPI
ncbi:MAG: GNAT family N-acetyltransferase [Hydrogenovibrio sp.]